VPRPPLIRNRYFIGFIVEREIAVQLNQLARAQGISVSELCRRAILEYLYRASPQPLPQAPPLQAAPAPGQADGSGTAQQPVVETASERRWRMIVKLDEPMLESLIKETEKLEKRVAELEKVPVSMRMTEQFLNRRRLARQRLVELKKLARYLIRAGLDVPEETVDKLADMERRLDRLE